VRQILRSPVNEYTRTFSPPFPASTRDAAAGKFATS
jgi:hypothetical protein